jgi:hypothetical protein
MRMQYITKATVPLGRLCARLGLLLVLLALIPPALAQTADEENLERKVKAAFLYRFTGYADWPPAVLPAGEAPLVIGVMGADDVAAELTQIVRGRSAGSHPLMVRRLREGDFLAGVHMLFVGGGDRSRIAAAARAAQQRSVLLVSEAEGALALGSTINFLLVEGRVRFEVSTASAERSGVKLSSRLLTVAYRVGGS